VDAQRRYLGGDSDHSILVKGLDFALFEQNRVRLASASSKQDDEALEEVFAHTASTSSVPTPKKRSRADIVNELKEKRANGGESEQSNEKAVVEKQPNSTKFRPIGFKPIGAPTGDKAKKKKGKEGNEPRKKKRKVEPPSLDAGEEAGPKDATPLPAPVDHAVSTTAPHEPIQPTPVEEDFDIFADAGEYKGVEFESGDDDDEGSEPAHEKPPHTGLSVASAEDAQAQRRGWFDDAAAPKPEAAAAAPPPRTPAKPPTSVPEARVEAEEEQSATLAPLSSSAMPSIRDFLAMDEAVEKEEKRKARKEKRKGKDKGS
jgi:IK cytokine